MSDSGFNDELIGRLTSREEHAFVELFSLHRARLKRLLEFRMDRRLRGREDASDILQEVYIDAHQRMRHYLKRPKLSFYVWLRQLTTQRLIDVHRRHLKAERRDVKQEVVINRTALTATSASMAVQLASYLASPSQIAMHAELVTQIEKALGEMDEIDREVIALRHFEELTNAEAAQILGLSPTAAYNRYARALRRLRDVLDQLPGGIEGLLR